MTALIEDYAMIGDSRTAAIICRDGSIDRQCMPSFNCDACFAGRPGQSPLVHPPRRKAQEQPRVSRLPDPGSTFTTAIGLMNSDRGRPRAKPA